MQGDGLGADEVVASGQVGGDGELEAAALLVEDVGAPELVLGRVAVLGDLEEGVGAVGGGGVGDGGHVDDDGAVVVAADGGAVAGTVAGLLVHLDLDGGAG